MNLLTWCIVSFQLTLLRCFQSLSCLYKYNILGNISDDYDHQKLQLQMLWNDLHCLTARRGQHRDGGGGPEEAVCHYWGRPQHQVHLCGRCQRLLGTFCTICTRRQKDISQTHNYGNDCRKGKKILDNYFVLINTMINVQNYWSKMWRKQLYCINHIL